MEQRDINDSLKYDYWFIAIFINIIGNLIGSIRWCLIIRNKSMCFSTTIYYIGNIITKVSFGFGPIALLLPLYSLIIVFDTLFKSKVNRKQIIGIIIIFVGLAISIIFGPQTLENVSYHTIEDLLYKFNESSSLLIIALISCFVIINWIIMKIKFGNFKTDEFYMLTYIHIASYFGSWNIVLTKCLLELISSSLISKEYAELNWTHWFSYIICLTFILSFIGVENWKYKAFQKYNYQYVIAIYTFLLITIGIILGSMIFDEFTDMTLTYLIFYFIAILITFIGIGVVSFKNDNGGNNNSNSNKNDSDKTIRMDTFEHSKENDNNHNRYNPLNEDETDREISSRLHRESMLDWNNNQINWQNLGQILMDHEFIDSVEATNLTLDHLEDFFEEEDILCDDFRDALCASYCVINDEGTILWQILSNTLNYTKEIRQRFYDLLLHEYFNLTDITVTNMIQILSKMTRELGVTNTQFKKIKEIILNKKLDGFKFETYTNLEFVKLFRSIRDVSSDVWSLIYDELMYWSYQQFHDPSSNQVDWEYVGTILWDNDFMDDQDELNSLLDELESYFKQKNFGPSQLKEELCNCYGNKSDKKSFLREILYSTMNYSKQIRAKFYDTLLHKFFDLENLNCLELITILKRSVHKIDKNIDLNEFESIAKLHSLNGRDLAAIRNAEIFSHIFSSIKCDSSIWERIYELEISKWQRTPTELSVALTCQRPISSSSSKTQNIANIPVVVKEQTPKKRISSPKRFLSSPRNNDKTNKNDNNEVAECLIDILEEVATSNKPYQPSQRLLSQSKSITKQRKRRRSKNTKQIFPRTPRKDRDRKMSKSSVKSSIKSDVSILNGLDSDLKNLDKDLKRMVKAGEYFKQKQLLSFFIDSYDLIRLNKLISTSTDLSIPRFVKTYKSFKRIEEYIINKNKLNTKYKHNGEFFSKMLSNYYILFGSQICWKPSIKIEDSLGAFISYTFSISNAIQKYMIPQPQIYPLIIDLWIIPNKTITLNGKTIKNEIGDIDERLRKNKLRFIKKTCNSNDITQTSYSIQECLCSANIRHGLKHKNVNRVVFIIDRRYKNKDYLYCYIPGSKYSKMFESIQQNVNNVNDTLHICHTYHTSRFLLPSESSYINNSIGASDKCNGYMFALSFIIYKHKQRKNSKKGKKSNSIITNHTFKSKIYFYTQGGKIRFLPSQIATLWPRYFMNQNNNNINSIYNIHKFVKKLFGLNVDDPYFEKDDELQKSVYSELNKQFIINVEINDNDKSNDMLLAEQLRQWVLYKKTLCQSKINATTTTTDIEYESKQQIPSETSADHTNNTTPTMTFQFDHIHSIPLSTRSSHHNKNNSNSFGLGNISADTTDDDYRDQQYQQYQQYQQSR